MHIGYLGATTKNAKFIITYIVLKNKEIILLIMSDSYKSDVEVIFDLFRNILVWKKKINNFYEHKL